MTDPARENGKFARRTDGRLPTPYEPKVHVTLSLAQARALLRVLKHGGAETWIEQQHTSEQAALLRAHSKLNDKYSEARSRNISKRVEAMAALGEASPLGGP